ncbi:MAG: hypothetical protein ABIB79_05310 [archaeon]
MIKKRLLLSIFVILLLVQFVVADDNGTISVDDSDDEKTKIAKAYECLEDMIDDQDCDSLASEERIFALLATGKCRSDVKDDSDDNECWPESGSCEIKMTAQAILALDNAHSNTDDAEEWLIEQHTTPEDLYWYLQIENPDGETKCEITYDGDNHKIVIREDRKIASSAGSCLTLAQDNYWLRINSNCYDEEFEITCDKRFSTNLLYKKKTSSTVYISSETHGTSAEGTTKESVNSFCFGDDECDYEGSLWAALVLDYLDHDVSSFLPYLIAFADENEELLPEAFLYSLTEEYRTELLGKQKNDNYWDESGDKFYDTALALFSISDNPAEKNNAKDWLLEVQKSDGCWEGIRNTAFILAAAWPKGISGDNGDDEVDCEPGNGYCMSRISCSDLNGNVKKDYDCSGTFVCCDKEKEVESCSEMNGEICSNNEVCTGDLVSADDTYDCCVDGYCKEKTTDLSDCENNFGTCRTSCNDNEEEGDYDCDYGDACCVEKKEPDRGISWWIWLLIILIVLVVLGIIFKDKLRPLWFRFKSKFGGKPKPRPGFPGGGFQTPSRGIPMRRPIGRSIFPPSPRRPVRRPPGRQQPRGEIDDVLKKLKEMGK